MTDPSDEPTTAPDHRLSEMPSVGQVPRRTVSEVRLGLCSESHCSDRWPSFEQCSGNPMHTVHYPSIDSEDDWEPRVHIPNQPHVFHHPADRWFSEGTSEPVVRVNFPDGIHGHLHDREVLGQFDEPVNVPCIQPARTRPEVILLTHTGESCRTRPRTPGAGNRDSGMRRPPPMERMPDPVQVDSQPCPHVLRWEESQVIRVPRVPLRHGLILPLP